MAAHACFGPLCWSSSTGTPSLEQVRPGAGQSPLGLVGGHVGEVGQTGLLGVGLLSYKILTP